MNPLAVDMKRMVEELQALLDEEIALLDLRRGQLEELSKAIIRRDNDRLEQVLEEMERTQRIQAATDSRLNALRSALGAALGWQVAEVRLSRLIGELPADARPALEHRRGRIVALADRLRQRHLETAMLLTECARINQRLLEGLLPRGQELTTYGAEGPSAWRQDAGWTDQEL